MANSKPNTVLIGIVVAVLVVAGFGFWYWQKKPSMPASSGSTSQPVSQTSVDQKTADLSLGSQILQRTQNLLRDRFPETNPLKQIIKNPF